MNLTEFESLLIKIGSGIIITALGFTIGYMIRWFNRSLDKMERSIESEAKSLSDQIAKEASAREEGDLKLATLLKETAEALGKHQLDFERRASTFIVREELIKISTTVDNKMDKFHARLDDIMKLLHGFNEKMVTREECRRNHDAG